MLRKLSYKQLESRVKELERRLRVGKGDLEALRRLVVVVRDSNDAITVQDFKGNITAWNRGAERMYGYRESEALKMNIRNIVPESNKKEALAFVDRISKGQRVDSFETQRLTKDRRVLDVWLTATALMDEAGKPIAVATTERDITERKQAERERIYREKFGAVLEIAGAVCHELNQPLQCLFLRCERLLNAVGKADARHRELQKIMEKVEAVAEITKKLERVSSYQTREYIEGTKIVDIDKALNGS
ncbi:MAG: PAS domain S-box protein [Deltaproteobacteria bacterium]|nr:PAS domain S-box protein [Deltaproteobacteria bacterium]MBW1794352.1 PAS domain S-box protein [Deltaproteobacteria bacterium]